LLTWAKLGSVCLVSGLLLAAAAALAPASSTFFLIDASACIALAIGFYVVAMKTESPQPQPQPVVGNTKAGWGVNVLLTLVVLSASTPLIKTGIETAARGASGIPIINKVTCPLSVAKDHACKGRRCKEGRRAR
jgi:hypothetical protein